MFKAPSTHVVSLFLPHLHCSCPSLHPHGTNHKHICKRQKSLAFFFQSTTTKPVKKQLQATSTKSHWSKWRLTIGRQNLQWLQLVRGHQRSSLFWSRVPVFMPLCALKYWNCMKQNIYYGVTATTFPRPHSNTVNLFPIPAVLPWSLSHYGGVTALPDVLPLSPSPYSSLQ